MPTCVRMTGAMRSVTAELVDQDLDRQVHAEPRQHRLDPDAARDHQARGREPARWSVVDLIAAHRHFDARGRGLLDRE